MGQGGSRSERELLKKKSRDYRLPEVRAKDRYTVTDNTNLTTAYEASVDKVPYYFLDLRVYFNTFTLTISLPSIVRLFNCVPNN
jgi:hypothetical protein